MPNNINLKRYRVAVALDGPHGLYIEYVDVLSNTRKEACKDAYKNESRHRRVLYTYSGKEPYYYAP